MMQPPFCILMGWSDILRDSVLAKSIIGLIWHLVGLCPCHINPWRHKHEQSNDSICFVLRVPTLFSYRKHHCFRVWWRWVRVPILPFPEDYGTWISLDVHWLYTTSWVSWAMIVVYFFVLPWMNMSGHHSSLCSGHFKFNSIHSRGLQPCICDTSCLFTTVLRSRGRGTPLHMRHFVLLRLYPFLWYVIQI